MVVVAKPAGEGIDLVLHVGELLLNGEHILDRLGDGEHFEKARLLRFVRLEAALHVVILHRHILHVCIAVGNVADIGERSGEQGKLVARHADGIRGAASACVAAGDARIIVAGDARALHETAELFYKSLDLFQRGIELGRLEPGACTVDNLLAHVGRLSGGGTVSVFAVKRAA